MINILYASLRRGGLCHLSFPVVEPMLLPHCCSMLFLMARGRNKE
jgi:hypothetical protein